jgi:tRNA-dihydrouridine synthase
MGARYICAPMVLQSELAFRSLVRARGVELCYAPMVTASPLVAEARRLGLVVDREKQIGGAGGSLEPPGRLLTHRHTVYMANSECLPTHLSPLAERTYFSQVVETTPGAAGVDAGRAAALSALLLRHGYDGHLAPAADRPLVAQLAANDPSEFAAAARLLCHPLLGREQWPDAVDLNLGCPCDRAARDRFGAALLPDPELCSRIVRAGSTALLPQRVPITAKIRRPEAALPADTAALALALAWAGAAAIAVHARLPGQRGDVPAEMAHVVAVVRALADAGLRGDGTARRVQVLAVGHNVITCRSQYKCAQKQL